MTVTYQWNWSWSPGEKVSSNRVGQTSLSLTTRATPSRGAYDVTKLNSMFSEMMSDLSTLYSQWNTIVQPVIGSLPAGGADRRWRLRNEIDVFSRGIDGSTLFVSNDASTSRADGRYWHTSESRPLTITEAIENLWGIVIDLQSTGTGGTGGSSTFDDTDLWDAVGWSYNGGTSAAGSLDYRTSTVESRLTHIVGDLWGPAHSDPGGAWAWPSWTWGQTAYTYGAFEWLYGLLQIHGGLDLATGKPWDLDHTGMGAHTHPQTEILLSSGTKDRTTPSGDLQDDMRRLRYEIEYTRGTSWASGTINGPFTTNYPAAGNLGQTLYSHINYKGPQPASSTNPHGTSYYNTGAGTVFGYVRGFTGMSSNADGSPTYSSTAVVTQGVNLETAIGQLDLAVSFNSLREDYYYDRTSTPEETRETTPIQISHGFGRKPLVHVLDYSPPPADLYGQYISEDLTVNIVHLSDNLFQVWTGAAYVHIIAFY